MLKSRNVQYYFLFTILLLFTFLQMFSYIYEAPNSWLEDG